MSEEIQPAGEEKSRTACGIKSGERILFYGEYQDKKICVCAGYLPMLIQGDH